MNLVAANDSIEAALPDVTPQKQREKMLRRGDQMSSWHMVQNQWAHSELELLLAEAVFVAVQSHARNRLLESVSQIATAMHRPKTS